MKKFMALFFLVALAGAGFGQTFQVTTPDGGERWLSGSHHDITWTYANFPAGTKVKLMLIQNGTKVGTIVENQPIGSNGAGKYGWTVGSFGSTAVDGYKVRIRDMNNAYPYAESYLPFSITKIQHQMMTALKKEIQHAVYSQGIVTIHINLTCDLDLGKESSAPGCDDFWWMQNSNPPHQRLFIPCAAHFKTLGIYADASWAVLHNVSFPSQQNPIQDADLPNDMVVAYRTSDMRWGSFRVVGKGSDNCLTIAWVTYQN